MGTLTINNAACNVVIYPVEYGLLYNWYAATDVKNIAAIGWHVPSDAEWTTLTTYLGGEAVAGGKLKETGLTYWSSPNTDATNEVGFNGRAGYDRLFNGSFQMNIGDYGFLWSSTERNSTTAYHRNMQYTSTIFERYSLGGIKGNGLSVRLIKDSTTLSHGQTGTYTGNDGKIYGTICINGVEYLAYNLAETKFRDNSIIPWYGANPANYFTNAEWAALTTSGVCAYSNTLSNVATGFTFPS